MMLAQRSAAESRCYSEAASLLPRETLQHRHTAHDGMALPEAPQTRLHVGYPLGFKVP